MKKILLCLLVVVVLLPIVNAETLDLSPNARSAILIEASTGEILYQQNIHEKLAPASMTKMMSMLLIIENIKNENLKWDEKIKVSANAAGMGGSQIFLETGEVMTVEDLFKGIAIGSANDATVALAERVAGNEQAFVQMMNERVRELGLKNTHFKNSHGLDAANHYSSAYDMAMIAKELVKYQKALEYSSIYETHLQGNRRDRFWLVNTNKLVRFYKGVDGLKTGFTQEAGYCLTATANKNNMRLIAVVMGAPTGQIRNHEISGMLDYGYNLYNRSIILNKDDVVGKIEIEKGRIEKVDVIPIDEVSVLYKKGTSKRTWEYKLTITNNKAPIKNGDVVGYIDIIEKGKVVRKIDATVKQDVGKANILQLYIRYFGDIIRGNINFR